MEAVKADSMDEAAALIFGKNVRIEQRRAVYGGDINDAYKLTLSNGDFVFVKCNLASNLGFFIAEEKGLAALSTAGVIGVPKALGLGIAAKEGTSFLFMQYLSPAARRDGYWEIFGRELAALHLFDPKGFVSKVPKAMFGFDFDNYIGASPQVNAPRQSWIEFFRECRLIPQIKMAEKRMDASMIKKCGRLLDRLDSFLEEPKFPSLLHGDLWSGNAVCGPDGKAWILDPAAYVGHFEAELAMTELFGGYPRSFYDAYNEVNPIDGGYSDRRDLYNLYHMLNHLNLFGGSYRSSVKRILDRYV